MTNQAQSDQMQWAKPQNATRQAGIERLDWFLPRAGTDYAKHRNFDLGPAKREHVSGLSLYTRSRLVSEDDIAKKLLAQYGTTEIDKFLSEVCWRTYWKGYLELQPDIWSRYREDLRLLREPYETHAIYKAALQCKTGIECMDFWLSELKETGYLHNHARMWFASIWIFTLQLPWQLGAELFLSQLIDGDPAVNTLSWRWVAGLHTKGKTYLARSSNIRKYTNERFAPRANELAPSAAPLEEGHNRADHVIKPLADLRSVPEEQAYRLLLWPDDLTADLSFPPDTPKAQEYALVSHRLHLTDKPSQLVSDWWESCLTSTQRRIESSSQRPCPIIESEDQFQKWIHAQKSLPTYWMRPFVGQSDKIQLLSHHAKSLGSIGELRRPWDQLFFPKASRSFFALKKSILPNLKKLAYINDHE